MLDSGPLNILIGSTVIEELDPVFQAVLCKNENDVTSEAQALAALEPGWVTLLSPYHTLGTVQGWVFGLSRDTQPVMAAFAVLVITTVVSLAVLSRRVSSPMRA